MNQTTTDPKRDHLLKIIGVITALRLPWYCKLLKKDQVMRDDVHDGFRSVSREMFKVDLMDLMNWKEFWDIVTPLIVEKNGIYITLRDIIGLKEEKKIQQEQITKRSQVPLDSYVLRKAGSDEMHVWEDCEVKRAFLSGEITWAKSVAGFTGGEYPNDFKTRHFEFDVIGHIIKDDTQEQWFVMV